MKTVAAFLLVGMLILWTDLPTGKRSPRTRYRQEKHRGWEGAVFAEIF